MMEELRHLWRLPADNDIQIEAESITSAASEWADALSRDRGLDGWTFGRRASPCLPHALAHLRACRVGATWGCRPGLCVGDMSPLPNTMSKRAPGAPPRAWPAAAGGRTAFPSSRGRAADRASRRRPAPPQDLCPGKRRVARRYHNPPLPSHTWRARRRVVQRVRRARGLLRVVASKGDCRGAEWARERGVDVVVWPREDGSDAGGEALLEEMQSRAVGVVVLAGYLKLVPECVVRAYDRRWGRLAMRRSRGRRQ